MRIVVDINHPAHVHYFKHFIWEMKKRGHTILITASNKEISYKLLDNYNFEYVKLGSYGKSIVEKIFNTILLDIRMYLAVRKFKPDIFVGSPSIRAAHVSKLMGKPSIAFEDSEPSPIEHLLYVFFTDLILTPISFRKNFGKKHFYYNGFMELSYLHSSYFSPNPSSLDIIGVNPLSKFVLMRFVSWEAIHDIGKKGFDLQSKIRIIREISKEMKVFISSESALPKELEPYKIKIPPENIHDILYYSQMLITDSQTMTTEAALLGTPAIRCNSFVGEHDMGNFIDLEHDYGLIFNFNDQKLAIDKALTLLNDSQLKTNWKEKRTKLLQSKIDVTSFMIWLIETYPESLIEMRKHRDLKNWTTSAFGDTI